MIEKHNLSGIIPYPSIERRPRRHMVDYDIFRIGGKIPHQADTLRKTFVKSVRVHLRLITKLPQNLVHIEKLAARRVRRMQGVGDLNDFNDVPLDYSFVDSKDDKKRSCRRARDA